MKRISNDSGDYNPMECSDRVRTTIAPAVTAEAARPTSRDNQLDALRGLLLVLMTLNHLPSKLHGCTFDYLGFVSEAEGFVFLSGYVAGLVYTRISLQHSEATMWARALARVRTIYLYHAILFVFLFFVIRTFGQSAHWNSWSGLFHEPVASGLLFGITLLNQPNLMDILPMYCLFLFCTPMIIGCFKKRRTWVVLSISVLLWSIAQKRAVAELGKSLRHLGIPINFGDFDFCAWQILFVTGLYFGFLHYSRKSNRVPMSKTLLIGIWSVAVLLFLLKHHILDTTLIASIGASAQKPTLGILRILNFAVVYSLLAAGRKHLKVGAITKSLAVLGRHSLQVFAWHILVVNSVYLIYDRTNLPGETDQVIIVLISVASMYLVAWFLERPKAVQPRTLA